MTSPITGRPKALNQNGPKKDIPKVGFSSSTLHRHLYHGKFIEILILWRYPNCFTYLCVCRRASKLILPFLVVRLAFAAGLAAFMPVVP